MLAVQEHKADEDRLADVQRRAADKGWSGVWSPAVVTDKGGTSGGLAVLTRGRAMVTAPPCRSDPCIYPGRAMAARVHWGFPGGIVIITVYLVVGEGLSPTNMAILRSLAT